LGKNVSEKPVCTIPTLIEAVRLKNMWIQ